MPKSFEEMSAAEFSELPPGETVFVYPIGVLEDHGPHLPLGLDLLEARYLSLELAKKIESDRAGWRAVVMPAAPLSADAETTRLALTSRPYVVRDWLVDSATSLWKQHGFKFFLAVSGSAGPKQLATIEDAGKLLRMRAKTNPLTRFLGGTKPALVSVSSAFFKGREALRSPLWADPEEHGGERDTSIALALAPAQVAKNYATLPRVERDSSWLARFVQRRRKKAGSYWGDPSKATASRGEEILRDKLTELIPKVHAVLDGENPERVFKSWFSVFPPNQSFFRAWMLSLLLALVLVAWVWWTFKGMTT